MPKPSAHFVLAALFASAFSLAPAQAQHQPIPALANPVPLQVLSTTPSPESLTSPPDTNPSITFNQRLNPATVNSKSVNITGHWTGPVPGKLILSNNNRTLTLVRDRPFSAGESVNIALSTSLRASNGALPAHPYASTFWIKPKPANLSFTKTATLNSPSTPYGGFGGDLDRDGDLDLAIPNEDSSNISIFLNSGPDNYSGPTTFPVGYHCSHNEGLDLNNDGIVDFAIANILASTVSILIGNGDGTFKPQVVYTVGNQPRGLAAFDVDGDGDPDVITSNRGGNSLSLLLNKGDGTFSPQTTFDGGVNNETSVSAADMNEDGITDLVVAGYISNNIAILLGDGKGGFKFKSSQSCGTWPWMVTTGDVNNDGHRDVAVACSAANTAGTLLGNGAGGLGAYTAYTAPAFPISIVLADADGDADLDMSVSSYDGAAFTIYRNLGNGAYQQAAQLPATGAASCTVFHDRDGDGDLDLTAIDEVSDKVFLFRQ